MWEVWGPSPRSAPSTLLFGFVTSTAFPVTAWQGPERRTVFVCLQFSVPKREFQTTDNIMMDSAGKDEMLDWKLLLLVVLTAQLRTPNKTLTRETYRQWEVTTLLWETLKRRHAALFVSDPDNFYDLWNLICRRVQMPNSSPRAVRKGDLVQSSHIQQTSPWSALCPCCSPVRGLNLSAL